MIVDAQTNLKHREVDMLTLRDPMIRDAFQGNPQYCCDVV